MPAEFKLTAPFPQWPYQGPVAAVEVSQGMSGMKEIDFSFRCSREGLDHIGCGDLIVWAKLLELWCFYCGTFNGAYGLPCIYDEHLLR